MSQELKKILVITTNYAPPAIGGPQNLYNLLRDFPPDSYFILTSFYNIDNLSAQKGNWLAGEYVFYDKTRATKKGRQATAKDPKRRKGPNWLNWLKHLARRSRVIRAILGIPIIFTQIFWIIRQGKKSIRNKKIEILLGFSDYGPAVISTYLLHKITRKPFFIFLFDIYKGNFFPFPGGLLSKIFEPKLFKRAETIIVTNEGTKKFYIKRYGEKTGKKITVIHNSVFPEPYLNAQSPYEPKPPYIILFTGRIYWPQIRSLKNLIKAIEEINDIDLRFKIYCPNPPDYLKKIGIVESNKVKISVASPQDIPKIQSQADILFLPLSWRTKSPDIINTATPGKLTDYLAAGRPMLIHAPPSSALVRYAKEKKFAFVVDEENINKLKDGIRKLISDKIFAREIIRNARETFFKNHNANKNVEIFKSLFQKTI